MESLSAAAAAAAGMHVPGMNPSPSSAAAAAAAGPDGGSSTGYFHGLMFTGSQLQQQQQQQQHYTGPDYGNDLGTAVAEPYSSHSAPSSHLYTGGPLYDNLALMIPVVDDDGAVPRVRTVKRRVSSNRKERRRTHSINTAFAALRGCIPNVPSDTKLSKIKTLRLATSYIAYLMDILNKDDPKLAEGGFKADISRKIESREEKRKRESEEILKAISAHNEEKPSRGRTGWPQQVWAAELKQ